MSDVDAVSDILTDSKGHSPTFTHEEAYDFKGYHAHQETYARWTFASNMSFMIARKKLREAGITSYDAALPAAMQMLARSKISPCGWVSVRGHVTDERLCSGSGSRKDDARIVRADWTAVVPIEDAATKSTVAPFTIMAFDIECASSHGEFPCARKRYERVARELAALPDHILSSPDDIAATLCAAFAGGKGDEGPSAESVADIGRIYTRGGIVPTQETICDVARSIAKDALAVTSVHERRALAYASLFGKRAVTVAENGPQEDDETDGALATTVAGGTATVVADADATASSKPSGRYDRILRALQASGANLPRIDGDPIIQIGAVNRGISGQGGDDDNHIFVLGECDQVPGVHVHTCTDERELLVSFFDHVRQVSPDFFTGYNTHGFDVAYIEARAKELDINTETLDASLFHFSTIQSALSISEKDLMDSRHKVIRKAGTADREETSIDMLGRVSFDLMYVVQKGHNLPSYKLDSVAYHFTGERKDDVTPAQIFASHGGSASDRALVAKYCVQDCALVIHLVGKLNAIMSALGMAGVCSVPVSWIFSRGQGAKTLSLVSRQCMEDGFAIPAMSRSDARVEYEGATVLDPKIGAYIDDPITVLDFASLYPSSMISSNISHDTLLLNEGCDGTGGHSLADDAIGDTLEYDITQNRVCEVSGDVLACERSGRTRARFVDPSVRQGILPRILEKLLAERKRVRGLIKTEPDPFRRSTLDGLQLAYKITANSLYGQLGAPTSPVFLPDLAAAETWK